MSETGAIVSAWFDALPGLIGQSLKGCDKRLDPRTGRVKALTKLLTAHLQGHVIPIGNIVR